MKPLQPGDQVARYVLLRSIAEGGMGEVWLARQTGLAGFSKLLALKTIKADRAQGEAVSLFLREARLAAAVNHPNVLQVFDVVHHEGRYFLAMEYLEGRNLSKVFLRQSEREQPFPAQLAARIIAECCAGLDHAHDLVDASGKNLGLVHRDISLENIFLTRFGQVKLLDFGLAKAAEDAQLTRPGVVRGKASYLSPEQLQGRALDRRTDLWALGVCLYHLLAGKPPFSAEASGDLMRAIVYADPQPPGALRPELGPALERVILRALEKQPGRRYPSAAAMRTVLEELLEAGPPAGAYQLARFINELFPEVSDPEQGTADQTRVARSPVLGAQTAAAVSAGSSGAFEATASVPWGPGKGKSRRWLLALLGLTGGVAAAVLLLPPARVGEPAVHRGAPPAPSVAPAKEASSPHRESVSALPDASSSDDLDRPSPPGPGELVVHANLRCEVQVDGQRVGQTPVRLQGVEPGAHLVTLIPPLTEGRARKESRVEVLPGQIAEWKASFGRGKLRLYVTPWADVQVDGKPVGQTPLPPLVLLEGQHEIILENAELGEKRRQLVEVRAGGEHQLNVRLAK